MVLEGTLTPAERSNGYDGTRSQLTRAELSRRDARAPRPRSSAVDEEGQPALGAS